MSSFSALGAPLLSVYGASKAFVMKWSEDMEMEYSRKGVTIMCAYPFYVVSNMSKIRSESYFIKLLCTHGNWYNLSSTLVSQTI